MTKPWTSVAAMVLVEEGRLRLGDPVSKYLPAFKSMQVSAPRKDPASGREAPVIVPMEHEMTIQDLLRHTSGLVYPGPSSSDEVTASYVAAGLGPDVEDEKLSAAEWTNRLSKVLLAHQPGTTWHYGVSTDLLGRVVEAATGKRLSSFLEEVIFRPLGMTDSGFSVPKEKLGRLAQPFGVDRRTGKKVEMLDVTRVPGNDLGGMGGVSTIGDYLRFCQMLLSGGRLGNARVLGRATVSYMASDHLGAIPSPFPGYGFGLGFAVRQATGVSSVIGSPGDYSWCGFAGTYFWIDPKEELVGVLMVQSPGARCSHGNLFRQVVYQALVD
jgi:CubicO group peptidase (beta-lactamase class C family)